MTSISPAWISLIIAGFLEIVWALGLKYSEGFSRLWPSAVTILAMGGSFWLLSRSLRTIPVGTGYAVWTGIGATGAALLGIVLLQESRSLARLTCILLIVAGIVGLKMTSGD